MRAQPVAIAIGQPEQGGDAILRGFDRKQPTVFATLLGSDHARLLAEAIPAWGYADPLLLAVCDQHLDPPPPLRSGDLRAQAGAIIDLADRLAHACLLGASGNDILRPLQPACTRLGIDRATLPALAAVVGERALDLKLILLSQLIGKDWPQFAQRHRQRLLGTCRPLLLGEDAPDRFALLATALHPQSQPAGPCTVAIIDLGRAPAPEPLFRALIAQEAEQGCGRLPLLVICPPGRTLRWNGGDRPVLVLRDPPPVARVLEALDELGSSSRRVP